MRLKEFFLTLLALSLLVISFEAHAQMPDDCKESVSKMKTRNPHHKLLIALEGCVRKKEDGPRVISRARDLGMTQLLFHCFVVNDDNRRICSEDYIYERETGTIYFHANFNGASFPELVSLVYQAVLGY